MAVAALILSTGLVDAWEDSTYEFFAKKVCERFGCECMKDVVAGSTKPDYEFKDQPTHHCYKPEFISSMEVSSYYKKPKVDDCPALDKTAVWLDDADKRYGCGRWESIGIASHYFLDAKEFWNNVVEVNTSCVKEYESEVTDYISFGKDNWRACECGVCTTASEFNDWLVEYSERVKVLIEAKKPQHPSVVIVSNDLDNAGSEKLGSYLLENGVSVVYANPSELQKYMSFGFLVVAGGHNAKDIGAVVDSTLTDVEKNTVLRSVLTGSLFIKRNVWVNGQTVFFIAGHEVEETAQGLWDKRGEVINAANEAVDVQTLKCVKNSDCGTSYWGPWVCTTRTVSSKTLYKPVCKLGKCITEAERPVTKGCSATEFCTSFYGCVDKTMLTEVEMVKKPIYYSWLGTARMVAIMDVEKKYSIYLRVNNSASNFSCQVYTPDGWVDKELTRAYGVYEIRLNVSSNRTGDNIISNRLRCGNETAEGEFITAYSAEHNLTLTVIPPPLAFTFSLKPQRVHLKDCFDKANVTIRVENFAGHNITCNYTVDGRTSTVKVPRPGITYDVTGGYWTWEAYNETYEILSYYSGSDFPNTTFTKEDEEGNITVYNISESLIESYSNQPKNATITRI
ncbi:MAG: hypothetical protein KKD39_00515, partial [Candidatus Altiarchaeota archaeon]|nr:hypothetical protein [Candidatus Altiarchaeota archaeon]